MKELKELEKEFMEAFPYYLLSVVSIATILMIVITTIGGLR